MRVIVCIPISMLVHMGEPLQFRLGKMWGSRNAQSRRTTPTIDPWVYNGLGGESTGQGGSGGGSSSENDFNNNADDDGPQERNTVVAATSQQDNNLRQAVGKTSLNVVRDNIWVILGALRIVYTILGIVFGTGIYITRDMAKKSDIKDMAKKSDIEDMAKKSDIKDMAKKSDIEDMAKKSDSEDMAKKSDIELLRKDLVIMVLVNAIVVMLVEETNKTGRTGVTVS